MKSEKYSLTLGGEKMTFEFTDMVDKADSSVLVSLENTKVLVTVCRSKEDSKKDYLPLRVDYQEKYYATAEILGSKYKRREGKPSTEAILSARVVDRAIRPYFDKSFRKDVQIVCTVLSLGNYDPDVLSICGASLALHVSDIPWSGPVGAVRVCSDTNKKIYFNPDYKTRAKDNYYELTVSGISGKVSMIEAEASEVKKGDLLSALQMASDQIDVLCDFFEKIRNQRGKEKLSLTKNKKELEIKSKGGEIFKLDFRDNLDVNLIKILDDEYTSALKEEFYEKLSEACSEALILKQESDNLFETFVRQLVRDNVVKGERRMDGRAFDELRPLYVKAGGFSRTLHGTGIFYRGGTKVLSVLTLGQLDDSLFIREMEIKDEKNFIHHYNFPPYSVGEVGKLSSPNRRELGHGALVEKSLKRQIPSEDSFPYTMRVVSEVMSSSGSTSMASLCASTLALLDGGVPIKAPVAGIAVGMVKEEGRKVFLLDIEGHEDFYGDMDFKISGTKEGVCAIQLDMKCDGLEVKEMSEVFDLAEKGRVQILDIIASEISKPNSLPSSVERVEKIVIPKSKIGLVIGKGGVKIKEIIKISGARIDIKNDGDVFIFGKRENIEIAKEEINKIVKKGLFAKLKI